MGSPRINNRMYSWSQCTCTYSIHDGIHHHNDGGTADTCRVDTRTKNRAATRSEIDNKNNLARNLAHRYIWTGLDSVVCLSMPSLKFGGMTHWIQGMFNILVYYISARERNPSESPMKGILNFLHIVAFSMWMLLREYTWYYIGYEKTWLAQHRRSFQLRTKHDVVTEWGGPLSRR